MCKLRSWQKERKRTCLRSNYETCVVAVVTISSAVWCLAVASSSSCWLMVEFGWMNVRLPRRSGNECNLNGIPCEWCEKQRRRKKFPTSDSKISVLLRSSLSYFRNLSKFLNINPDWEFSHFRNEKVCFLVRFLARFKLWRSGPHLCQRERESFKELQGT